MNFLKLKTTALFATAVVLVSCAPKERLTPEEVMSRTADVNKNLSSVLFELDGKYSFSAGGVFKIDGDVRLKGSMQGGGERVYSDMETSGVFSGPNGSAYEVSAEGAAIAGNAVDTLFRINGLSSSPEIPLFADGKTERILNKWWRIGEAEPPSAGAPLTPDPKIIRAQSEVVDIVSDLGFDHIGGKKMYHYETVINSGKLYEYAFAVRGESMDKEELESLKELVGRISARGEIWIDSEDFYVRKINWDIKPVDFGNGYGAGAEFSMEFSGHNKADPFPMPKEIFTFSADNLITQGSESEHDIGSQPLPKEFEDAIINKILE